jgi:hypothetical protein
MLACFSHSSPQSRQAAAQASNILRIISSSDPVRRVAILPVMLQTSAQSRSSRMHWASDLTLSSAKQASAQDVQVWAQE